MTAKYTRVPLDDPGSSSAEETAIDFGSAFTYDRPSIEQATQYRDKKFPKYFSYSHKNKYRSAFTYSDHTPGPMEMASELPPGMMMKLCASIVIFFCYVGIFLTFPVSMWCCLKKVHKHEKMVVFRLGKLLAPKNPGRVIVIPCIDKWTKVDIRTKAFSVPPMQLITADSAIIEYGADIFYQIKDPVLSIAGVQDLNQCLRVMSQTTLKRLLAKRDLSDIEKEKALVTSLLQDELNKGIAPWGVHINKIEISQVKVLKEPQVTNPLISSLLGEGGSGESSSNPLSFLGSLLGQGSGIIPTVPGQATVSQQSLQDMGLMSAFMPPQSASKKKLPPITEVPLENTDTPEPGQRVVTPQEIVAVTRPLLSYDLVQDTGAILKFVVTGDSGGIFYLDLKNGTGSVGEGEPLGDDPDVTLTLTHTDLQALFHGQISAFNAYMGGRLVVDGDMRSAMGLQHLVDKIKAQLL